MTSEELQKRLQTFLESPVSMSTSERNDLFESLSLFQLTPEDCYKLITKADIYIMEYSPGFMSQLIDSAAINGDKEKLLSILYLVGRCAKESRGLRLWAAETFIRAIRTDYPEVRQLAYEQLGYLGSAGRMFSFELEKLINSETDENLRWTGICSLKRLKLDTSDFVNDDTWSYIDTRLSDKDIWQLGKIIEDLEIFSELPERFISVFKNLLTRLQHEKLNFPYSENSPSLSFQEVNKRMEIWAKSLKLTQKFFDNKADFTEEYRSATRNTYNWHVVTAGINGLSKITDTENTLLLISLLNEIPKNDYINCKTILPTIAKNDDKSTAQELIKLWPFGLSEGLQAKLHWEFLKTLYSLDSDLALPLIKDFKPPDFYTHANYWEWLHKNNLDAENAALDFFKYDEDFYSEDVASLIEYFGDNPNIKRRIANVLKKRIPKRESAWFLEFDDFYSAYLLAKVTENCQIWEDMKLHFIQWASIPNLLNIEDLAKLDLSPVILNKILHPVVFGDKPALSREDLHNSYFIEEDEKLQRQALAILENL